MTSTITAGITTLTGDRDAIRSTGRKWRTAAMACAAAAAQISTIAVVDGFLGDEAATWEHRLRPETSDLLSTLATARDIVGGALVSYADVLEDCQQELGALTVQQLETGAELDRWHNTPTATPDLVDSARQTMHDLDARAAAIHARHTSAVRACSVQIDRAIAMSPGHVSGIRPSVTAPRTGGGPGRFRQSSNAVLTGHALARPAQLSAIGPFLATDEPLDIDNPAGGNSADGNSITAGSNGGQWLDPATRERYFQSLYQHCLGTHPITVGDLRGEGNSTDASCRGYAESTLSSPESLTEAISLTPGLIAMPTLPKTTFADVWNDYVDALRDMGTMAKQTGDAFARFMFSGCMEGGSLGACLFDIASAPIPFIKGAKVVKAAVEVVDEGADIVKAGDKAADTARGTKGTDPGGRAPDGSTGATSAPERAQDSAPQASSDMDAASDRGVGVTVETGKKSAAISHGPAPAQAWDTYEYIARTGTTPNGFHPPKVFKNEGRRGQPQLPTRTKSGEPVTYTEYDVHPSPSRRERGLERLLIGSDGSAYYTSQHYDSYIVMIGQK